MLSTNDGTKSWVAERGVKLPSGIHAEGEAESGERVLPNSAVFRKSSAAPVAPRARRQRLPPALTAPVGARRAARNEHADQRGAPSHTGWASAEGGSSQGRL